MANKKNVSELDNKLAKLYEAFCDCAEIFDEMDETVLNEYIQEDYPFEESFGDLIYSIEKWVASCRYKISITQ